jgi:hypothetical protein
MKRRDFRLRRTHAVVLVAVGLVIGVTMMATPAMSHVGGTVGHLWNDHIKPRADARYANAVAGTDQAKNAAKLQGRTWGNFLGDVRVVVKSSGAISAGSFGTETVSCPAGYSVIAGGVDPGNVLTMRVTSSAPVTAASIRMYGAPDGQHAPTGWHGAVVNESASTVDPGFKVGVVCAKA